MPSCKGSNILDQLHGKDASSVGMTMGGVLTMYANRLFFGASSTLRHFDRQGAAMGPPRWNCRNGIEIFAIMQGNLMITVAIPA